MLNLQNQGHTCSLVRRTILVRSAKDYPLVSMAVWSDGPRKPPQTSMTQNTKIYKILLALANVCILNRDFEMAYCTCCISK